MNRKNIHIFRGLDTDSSPLSVKADFAEEIHNLRITANEAILDADTSVLNNPQNPINLTISPELSTRSLRDAADGALLELEGQYIGHCVCNEYLVVFAQTEDEDIITKYKLEVDNNKNLVLTKIIDLFRSTITEESFDVKYPIECLFCYENEKIQRLYWVDGKNQPRSINIANTETFIDYNDINFSSKINNINYNIDIVNIPESNGEFKPGVIQYAMTLVANNDAESSIFYISPMYYLTNFNRGESTDNMVHNILRIKANITNNTNFKRIRIYAIMKTSMASINTRLILDRAINDSSFVQVDDDGIIGETVDYTSLLYKGSENIIAYTMDQKDNTLFLGKLKYKRNAIPKIENSDYKINTIGVDYYGNAIYDYAGLDNSDIFKGAYGIDLNYHHDFDNTITHIRPGVSYTPYSPFSKKYYEDNRDLTRSSRGVKRFKAGEYYKLGIIGQLSNGKMTQVMPLDIVYNGYKPIFKQDKNSNSIIVHKGTDQEDSTLTNITEDTINDVIDYNRQVDTYITTGFRTLLTEEYINKCKEEGITKLYPVVVYPNNTYKAVLTQGLLSPTLVNIQETIEDYPSIINSWYYRPYAKGIFDDNRAITLEAGEPQYPSIKFTEMTSIVVVYNESTSDYTITFQADFLYTDVQQFKYTIDDGFETTVNAVNNSYTFTTPSFSSIIVYAYCEQVTSGVTTDTDTSISITFDSAEGEVVLPESDTAVYPNPIWTFNMQDFDAKGHYNSSGSLFTLKDKHSCFSDGLNYNGIYNFACITTGAHYRGLYSSAFPNGEIDNNIIGCPVDYLLIWNKSNKENWGRYGKAHSAGAYDSTGNFIHSSLDIKDSLRIQGPAMFYRENNNIKLLSRNNYKTYMSGNFLMDCNILTLNSPETEHKLISNTRGDIADYKFRIVGFSDYCSNRLIPTSSEEKPTISDIKNNYRLAKKSSYFCGSYNNTTYLKNRYIKSTPLERLGKWFRGVEDGTSDDGWIPLKNAYLGDCTWSHYEDGKYSNAFLTLKVSSNLAFGTTDYYITGGDINIESCTYALEEVGSLLKTSNHDYLFSTTEVTSSNYIADANMFNKENASEKGVRYTKLYNTDYDIYNEKDEYKHRLRSSWASSWFCHWRNDNSDYGSKGAKGDFDTVQNHTGVRRMFDRIPHILWWYPDNYTTPDGSTSEPINTIIDTLPVWASHTINDKSDSWEDINSLSSNNKYISSYANTGVPIKYHSSPYIAISLGKNNEDSEYVLCKDGYGKDAADYTPFWNNNNTENSSIDDENKTYKCVSILQNNDIKLYGNLDMVGQFIGELYRDPEAIGISVKESDNIKYIDYEESTYMGGVSEDPYHNWYICGDAIDLDNPSTVQLYNNDNWDTYNTESDKQFYELLFIEGDSYIGRFDSLKTYPYNQETQGVVEIFSTVLESRMNLDERVDIRDLDDLSTIVYSNFNLFNEQAYNQTPSLMTYHVEDENAIIVDNLPNTVTWSLEKMYGANIDEWAHVTMLNTLDLDGQYGVIESINNYRNNIYAFQNKAVSLINFNTRVQIPTSDNNPIEITNGYKVDGKVVLDNHYGCSNKWSIAVGLNGIYFIDDINNKACLFNGQQVAPLSSTANVQRLFNSLHTTSNNYYEEHLWNPETFDYCRCFYDTRRNEVYYVFKNKAIVFNEILGTFVGTFDYGETVAMFNIGDYYASIYNNQFYELFSKPDGDLNRSNFGEIYGETKPYNLTYIEHGNTANDKVFNTVEWQSNQDYEVFKSLSVGSVQHSNTSMLKYGYRGNVIRRFNYYRASLDRTTLINNKMSITYRERNPYFRVSLRNDSPSRIINPFLISNIITTFSE